ncbi:MAG: hypothetical protein QM784_13235 [Polyangiaceae bacterium]
MPRRAKSAPGSQIHRAYLDLERRFRISSTFQRDQLEGQPPHACSVTAPPRRFDATRLDATRLDATRLDATRLDATRLDATRLDATRLDATRLDATRLDATRLDATRLDATPPDRAHVYSNAVFDVGRCLSRRLPFHSGRLLR